MLSCLSVILACLLIFPLFTGTAQAERSPLCEGAIVVEDSYVGENISVNLTGAEYDPQEKTYTLYWLVDCMLEDPAAVSPDYSRPKAERVPYLALHYSFLENYAGEDPVAAWSWRSPLDLIDLDEHPDGFLCHAMFKQEELPVGADQIDIHFKVMRVNQESPVHRDYTDEYGVQMGFYTLLENYLLRFCLSDAVEAGT